MGELKKITSGEMTVVKAIGTIIPGELLSALEEFYTYNPTKFIIWDLTEASAIQLKSKYIEQIVKLVSRYKSSRPGGKTAIVAPGDLEFGVSRMLNIHGRCLHFCRQKPCLQLTWRSIGERRKETGNRRSKNIKHTSAGT